MNELYTGPKPFNAKRPALTLWEDGDWLRIEGQTDGTRYIHKTEAIALIKWIGQHSTKEKTDLIKII